MRTVTMLEFRKNALEIVRCVQRGQSIVLTYRGKAVAQLQPPSAYPPADDPFYSLPDLADAAGESLTNQQIDQTLYGQ